MLVLLNTRAGAGSAYRRWTKIARHLEPLLGPFTVCCGTPAETVGSIRASLETGERRFVAAGGDGTLNLLVNGLLRNATTAQRRTVQVGAIGLGSSNDFHKPAPRTPRLNGIRHRLDFDTATPHDVAVVECDTATDQSQLRYWLLNSSIGVTAEGNQLFNQPRAATTIIKRWSPSCAMVCAAMVAILRHRPRVLSIQLDDAPVREVTVSNLGIVKNPYFTGCLRYGTSYERDSGSFQVHQLDGVRLPGLLSALLRLAAGRFHGRHAHTCQARRILVEASEPFPLELDGEVVAVHRARFSILPGALQVCA